MNQALFLFIITNRKVTNGVTVAAFGDQPVMDWTVFWRTAPSLSSGWDTGSSSGTWVHTPCLQPRPSMACLPLRSTTFVNKISGKYIKHSFLLFSFGKTWKLEKLFLHLLSPHAKKNFWQEYGLPRESAKEQLHPEDSIHDDWSFGGWSPWFCRWNLWHFSSGWGFSWIALWFLVYEELQIHVFLEWLTRVMHSMETPALIVILVRKWRLSLWHFSHTSCEINATRFRFPLFK